MHRLPIEFLEKMKNLMDENEYKEFVSSFDMPRQHGLRVNTLKISVEHFLEISPFKLEKVPWARDGFYYCDDEGGNPGGHPNLCRNSSPGGHPDLCRNSSPDGHPDSSGYPNPGKHPYYHAGLYYIQEPSAMLPAEILDAKPGEYVLDLCAAPGGKAVQIAAGMKGQGLLVANDSNPARLKALIKNIELCGIRNAIVLNETPCSLAVKFCEYFDKILVDAPCSGEGMFRKDENAVKSWKKLIGRDYAGIQRNLLESAGKMLKPGGKIVYSTCTFSQEENEQVIINFLESHNGDYDLLEIPLPPGGERGRPGWAGGDEKAAGTVRLWPHKIKGEGHFVAALVKKGQHHKDDEHSSGRACGRACGRATSKSKYVLLKEGQFPEEFRAFADSSLNVKINDCLVRAGNDLYQVPGELAVLLPYLEGMRVAKFGWYLGRAGNKRFEPSHSIIMSLKKKDIRNVVDFPAESAVITRYLKGETLPAEGMAVLNNSEFAGVCVDGFTAGWAKLSGNMLKNLYPPGWRLIPSSKNRDNLLK